MGISPISLHDWAVCFIAFDFFFSQSSVACVQETSFNLIKCMLGNHRKQNEGNNIFNLH